jgi:peptidylprolyl isomerase
MNIARVAQTAALGLLTALAAGDPAAAAGRTAADILAASKPAEWRVPDPENTLYMELKGWRVVIELTPDFAPHHADNIRALVRAKFFDGLFVTRVQDNFVTQWGETGSTKPLGEAKPTLAAEFTRPAAALPFVALPDPDTYAPQVGFSNGMPAARDSAQGVAWAVHCYATVGVGRDVDTDSGGGTELYVVIGHSPRQLDRNITVVGRVLKGMEALSSLPRGTGDLGFYERPEERVPITQVRVAADVPADQRTPIEVLRTDSASFAELVEARRNRRDDWYKVPAGRIDVCNVPLPVRPISH